jgi:hypothetical protein
LAKSLARHVTAGWTSTGEPEVNDKSSKQKRARNQADAQFTRPAQTDKDSAMAEYKAQAQIVRDKTERLRALRLAKEAVEEKAAVKQKRAIAAKKTAKKSAKKPAQKTAAKTEKKAG